ncbi:MAG: ATP-dependent zinc metalloprotease FtsH [Planctomycetota bacterium]
MTQGPEQGNGDKQNQTRPQKPKGMGGVFIIFLLLLTLFWAVSGPPREGRVSLYEFRNKVLNGEFEKVVETQDGQLIGTARESGRKVQYEVSVGKLGDDMRAEMLTLQAHQLDRTTYQGPEGLARFADELKKGEIRVVQAWFVTWNPPRSKDTERTAGETDPPGRYLTAIIQRGNDESYVLVPPSDSSDTTLTGLAGLFAAKGVHVTDVAGNPSSSYEVREANPFLYLLLGTIAPWILIIGLFWFFIIRQMRSPGGSGGVLSFGRSRAHRYNKEKHTRVTFADVEGMEEAKDEVREVIEFLKNRSRFQKIGGRIPRGVLLVGPPGTGKTLLARAIAGEADVPFFSISGSDFVEMFVGVGASRVRDLFKQARESSPCIVFLDEIDAVGRKRGSGVGGGHDEREQTLNAILVEMDGFDTDEGIILIGATNRPDVLDPALLRPGRFDRQVVIDLPDVKGREQILRVHAKKIRHTKSLDFERLARATPGFSGAELAALINEAAILAAMKNKEEVTLEDCEEARDRVRWGREKKSRKMEEEDRRVTAYHEAGHALVGARIPGQDPVHKITIVSRGMALGATMFLPERDEYNWRKSKLEGHIAMAFGGRIAEEIVFGDISAGASNDIKQATRIARTMVTELGMSDRVGPVNHTISSENYYLGAEAFLSKEISDETARMIDEEVRKVIDAGYERARTILIEDRPILDRIAEALLRFETITGEELQLLIDGVGVDDLRTHEPGAGEAAEEPQPEEEARPEGVRSPEDDLGLSGAEGLATS